LLDFVYSLAHCVSSSKLLQLLTMQLSLLGFCLFGVCVILLTCQIGSPASLSHCACMELLWHCLWEVLLCTVRKLCSFQKLQGPWVRFSNSFRSGSQFSQTSVVLWKTALPGLATGPRPTSLPKGSSRRLMWQCRGSGVRKGGRLQLLSLALCQSVWSEEKWQRKLASPRTFKPALLQGSKRAESHWLIQWTVLSKEFRRWYFAFFSFSFHLLSTYTEMALVNH